MPDHYKLAALNADASSFMGGFSMVHNIQFCINAVQTVLAKAHDYDAHAEVEDSRRIDGVEGYSDEEGAEYIELIKQAKYAVIPQLESALEYLEEAYEEAADAEEEGAGW